MDIILPADELVDMRHETIHQTDAPCPGENAAERDEQSAVFIPLDRRENKPQDSSGEHYPCRKGQHNVTEPVGDFLAGNSQNGSQYRGTANPQGGQTYKRHHVLPFKRRNHNSAYDAPSHWVLRKRGWLNYHLLCGSIIAHGG